VLRNSTTNCARAVDAAAETHKSRSDRIIRDSQAGPATVHTGPVLSRSGDVRSCFLELRHPYQSRGLARMNEWHGANETHIRCGHSRLFRSAAPKTPDPGTAKEETSPQRRKTGRLRSPLNRADLKIRTTVVTVRLMPCLLRSCRLGWTRREIRIFRFRLEFIDGCLRAHDFALACAYRCCIRKSAHGRPPATLLRLRSKAAAHRENRKRLQKVATGGGP